MNYLAKYHKWLHYPELKQEYKKELTAIIDQDEEIQARFGGELEFGTGGLRGILGCGSNRINTYTIRKATLGLARYILESLKPEQDPCAVIAYDSRRMSREYALEAALVLTNNGIKAFVYKDIAPTPLLSFAVRELHATAGIVITASHNPPEYNGYKVYWADGGQITDARALAITEKIQSSGDGLDISITDYEQAKGQGLLVFLNDEILNKYLWCVTALSLNPQLFRDKAIRLRTVYTSLHGTGYISVMGAFREIGYENIYAVKDQCQADSNFPTVKSPNPENPDAFAQGIKLGKDIDADLLLATDPDADRIGAAVKNNRGDYSILSGNQLGALLLDYRLSQLKSKGIIPSNGIIVKTIVTSELGRAIAKRYGLETIDTLTGFKYIGEAINKFHKEDKKSFVFGYEESCGYLVGDFVRDKDAIQTCLITVEMALYYKKCGLTLLDRLEQIFEDYGYYQEELFSCEIDGTAGMERIQRIMEKFRCSALNEIAGREIVLYSDYLIQKTISLPEGQVLPIGLPPANVLKYVLKDNSWFCIRPSGTEPKLKIYFGVCARNRTDAGKQLEIIKKEVLKIASI